MLRLRQILFPVDFSSRCQAAARLIRAFASRFDADLTVLHVIELPVPGGLTDEFRERSREELDAFVAEEFAGCRVEPCTFEGDPAQTIVELTRKSHFDLIMMPTHGYGPFRRFLLGSVTAKVLHDADCPVWTAAHMGDGPVGEIRPLQQILCAVDFGPRSCPVMRWAAELSGLVGARLTVAHTIPVFSVPAEGYWVPDWRAEVAGSAEQEIGRMLEVAGIQASTRILDGAVAYALADAARDLGADLAVIGRTHTPGVMGRLGSNAYGIIAHSPCPVISI